MHLTRHFDSPKPGDGDFLAPSLRPRTTPTISPCPISLIPAHPIPIHCPSISVPPSPSSAPPGWLRAPNKSPCSPKPSPARRLKHQAARALTTSHLIQPILQQPPPSTSLHLPPPLQHPTAHTFLAACPANFVLRSPLPPPLLHLNGHAARSLPQPPSCPRPRQCHPPRPSAHHPNLSHHRQPRSQPLDRRQCFWRNRIPLRVHHL